MADLSGFDANQVEPTGDFDPIPAGKYLAVITDSEMKPNKAGTGRLLQFTFQIIEGEYQNRLIWTLHNLPLVIHVRCKKRNDTGDIVNEIKGFAKRETPNQVGQPVSAPPSNNSSPPWKRS